MQHSSARVAADVLSLVRAPRHFRYREATSQFETAALDAIPIVALVTFLIGVVIAYLLGVQAQQYGASDLRGRWRGLGMCREFSPILVAVIVAGRSGAAFTAQIGTMKVQEETDAIRMLGLSPIQVLVVPRLVAIIVGAAAAGLRRRRRRHRRRHADGALQLEISPATFLDRLHTVLPLKRVSSSAW